MFGYCCFGGHIEGRPEFPTTAGRAPFFPWPLSHILTADMAAERQLGIKAQSPTEVYNPPSVENAGRSQPKPYAKQRPLASMARLFLGGYLACSAFSLADCSISIHVLLGAKKHNWGLALSRRVCACVAQAAFPARALAKCSI